MEVRLLWKCTMGVTPLCDGIMCNGLSELWRVLFSGGGLSQSVYCVVEQCAMVHLDYEMEFIVWLNHGGCCIVVVDCGSQSIVW
jgi:hypothetical protein